MIFQWQLFLVLIVIAVLTPGMGMYRKVNIYGDEQVRYNWLPVIVLAGPMIYFAGTRSKTMLDFGDTSSYLSGFKNAPISLRELFNSFTEESKDKGFSVLTTVIKSIVGNREVIYFTIIAAVCILCVIAVYRKYSCNFIISAFLFIASGDYVQWCYNGIRQFIPVAVLFASIGLILKKKYIPFIILTLILSTIHATALLMVPMVFIVQGKAWNRKTLFLVIAVILAIASLEQFTDLIVGIMENTQYSDGVDQYLTTEGTSIQRVLVYSIPAILTFVFKRKIDEEDNPIVNLSANMALITAFTYLLSAFTSGIFLGRVPIYFSLYNYILLPWIIEHSFTKNSVQLIYIVLIGFYMVFYYYQMHITWGL